MGMHSTMGSTHSQKATEPHPLTEDGASRAVETLARAFMCDPVYARLFPEPEPRLRALRGMYDALVTYTLRYGNAAVASDGSGVACWLRPGATRVTLWRIIGTGFGLLRAVFRLGARARQAFLSATIHTDSVHHKLMQGPHWYLWALGVVPERQGTGIGTALLRPMLNEADRVDAPCYLETQTPGNVAFYERRGFRVALTETLPALHLPVWYMVRDPHP